MEVSGISDGKYGQMDIYIYIYLKKEQLHAIYIQYIYIHVYTNMFMSV